MAFDYIDTTFFVIPYVKEKNFSSAHVSLKVNFKSVFDSNRLPCLHVSLQNHRLMTKLELFPLVLLTAAARLLAAQCLSGDCLDGRGTYLFPSGARYVGEFRNGMMHGMGTCYYPDSSIYIGQWVEKYPHGYGIKRWPDGVEWKGQWVQGQPVDVRGALIPDLYAYAKSHPVAGGCLEGDCLDGWGKYIFRETGARYEGYFRQGLPHGQGIMYFPEGDWYEGAFVNGVFEGQGTYYGTDGSVQHGMWREGTFVAERPAPQTATTPSRRVPAGQTWAVIIGISWYQHMQPLHYTDDDAYRFWGFLLSPAGGAIPESRMRLLIDEAATREAILTTIEEVIEQVDTNDYFVLFYSGHGINGAFLPSDYDGTGHVLSHDELRELLARCPARHKLVLADACHAGSYTDELTAKGLDDELKAAFKKALEKVGPGTAIILSSRAEEISLESDRLRQGVFSHFLLRGLKGEADTDHDGIVAIEELFDYVQSNVQRYTHGKQTPALFGRFDPDMPVSIVRR